MTQIEHRFSQICFLLVFLSLAGDLFGQITLFIRADTTPVPPDLQVRLTLVNQGKEEAREVQVTLKEGERVVTLPARGGLVPGEQFQVESKLDIQRKRAGKYPLFVTVGYKDLNGYPFSAVLCSTFLVGEDTASDIFGNLSGGSIGESGDVRLRLKNTARDVRAFNVSLFAPRELSTEYRQRFELQGAEEREIEIPIRNFSALAGSRYPVYAVVEYEREGKHFTNVMMTQVSIVEEVGFVRRYRWWMVGIAIALLIVGFWGQRITRITRMS